MQSELIVIESEVSGYKYRTQQNANSAPLTVAFAVDYETAGERLTKKSAIDYLAIPLAVEPIAAARLLFRHLKSTNVRRINVAGNGLYTLSKHGWTQGSVNDHLFQVLRKVNEYWPLELIISGGQTGVDMAATTAARALGIHAIANLPKGFLQRDIDGIDREHTEQEIRLKIDLGAHNMLMPAAEYPTDGHRLNNDIEAC